MEGTPLGRGEATVSLRPWRPPTSTASPALQQPTQQATVPPGPTATPLTHIVQPNDTLLVIAAQYGVSLDALLAINPGLNQRFLSIGQALLIPGPEGEPITSLIPSATPIPLTFSSVTCTPTATGGLICLTDVRNPTDVTLEGLSARIDLLGDNGEIIDGRIAYAPINLLPPDGRMPLSAYFPPPAPSADSYRVSGLTAFPANEVEGRYVEVTIRRGEDIRGRQGSSWIVAGDVVVAPTAVGEAAKVVVLALGLDAHGDVAGYAVWEAAETPGPGESVAFRVLVVSLGRPIERVQLMAEALGAPTTN